MRQLGVLLSAAALLALGVGASSAPAKSSAVTVRIVSVANLDGIFQIVLACPGPAACHGTYGLPAYDEANTAFTIAAGKQWTHKQFIAGPLQSAKTILVHLVQTAADGTDESADRTVRLLQKVAAVGPGATPGPNEQDNGGGPHISAGPATRLQVITDPRGDNRSSFPLPIVYDIVRASAKRHGNAVAFSITTVQPMTLRNEGGIIVPCIEIPSNSPSIYPLFTFSNGKIPLGHGMPTLTVPFHISGTTVSWTVPHKVLYKIGFLWRATGGCDASHVADVAPNSGYKTFRWVTVKKS